MTLLPLQFHDADASSYVTVPASVLMISRITPPTAERDAPTVLDAPQVGSFRMVQMFHVHGITVFFWSPITSPDNESQSLQLPLILVGNVNM
jgi:hypothetical protein